MIDSSLKRNDNIGLNAIKSAFAKPTESRAYIKMLKCVANAPHPVSWKEVSFEYWGKRCGSSISTFYALRDTGAIAQVNKQGNALLYVVTALGDNLLNAAKYGWEFTDLMQKYSDDIDVLAHINTFVELHKAREKYATFEEFMIGTVFAGHAEYASREFYENLTKVNASMPLDVKNAYAYAMTDIDLDLVV